MLNRSIRSSRNASSTTARPRHAVFARTAFAISFAVLAMGCAPEVGSEDWCTQMKETPKGDWSTNQAVDFAKHCLL